MDPYLGQRCYVARYGFGTIVARYKPWSDYWRVEFDDGSYHWIDCSEMELLDTYPAG